MRQSVKQKRETRSGSFVPVIGIVAWIEKAMTVSPVIVPPMIAIIATREMTMTVSSPETAVMWSGLGLNRKNNQTDAA
jgi:hypothetical protein